MRIPCRFQTLFLSVHDDGDHPEQDGPLDVEDEAPIGRLVVVQDHGAGKSGPGPPSPRFERRSRIP